MNFLPRQSQPTASVPAAASAASEIDGFLARYPETRFVDALMFDLVGNPIGKRYPAAYAAIKRAELDAFLADILPREYDWYL